MIVWNILLLVIGFVALIKGADMFVAGSSSLARKFRVPGVIIGLTIVAAGTSAPELAVSTLATISGSNEIALSNVLGSNIFNLLGILGICAVIRPLKVEPEINRRDFPFAFVTTLALMAMTGFSVISSGAYRDVEILSTVGTLSRVGAAVLLAIFVAYIAFLVFAARKKSTESNLATTDPLYKIIFRIIFGLILIIAGGQAVVTAAKEVAAAFGMSETLIGLTIVAIGTSLPELVTSVVASRAGETGIAVGNVVGSNIFNLLFILGISGLITPLVVNMASFCDLAILIVVTLISYIHALTRKSINRVEGAMMIMMYVVYVVYAAVR